LFHQSIQETDPEEDDAGGCGVSQLDLIREVRPASVGTPLSIRSRALGSTVLRSTVGACTAAIGHPLHQSTASKT